MMKDIYILQIETATPVCSVALSRNGQTIAFKEASEQNIHASQLTLFIEDVMDEAAMQLAELDAVAVSAGPGSYTGLRIGVSTAKGLCYGLGIPLLAVETLEAMVEGLTATAGILEEVWLLPMIDARRMEVYSAVFDVEKNRLDATQARIIDADSFQADQDKQHVLFGSGAEKFQELFADAAYVRIAEGFTNSASHMSRLAFDKHQQGQFEDLVYYEPFYLKDFIASTPRKR